MFGISVSGIKNSQKHIDVTSNNIANTNSYGFKKSRAEFADVYANSVYTNSRVTTGMGVQNTVVSQQFAQGALSGDTGNPLDMAIQGNGFFVLSGPNGDQSHTYTRNGAFQVNNEGYIVTATGDFLQGWDVDDQGRTASLDLNATHNIQIPSKSFYHGRRRRFHLRHQHIRCQIHSYHSDCSGQGCPQSIPHFHPKDQTNNKQTDRHDSV